MRLTKTLVLSAVLLLGGLFSNACAESNRRRFEDLSLPDIECSRIDQCLDDAGDISSDSLTSGASDPADAGVVRMGTNEYICWEYNPTGTDICLGVNSSSNYLEVPAHPDTAFDINGITLLDFAALYENGADSRADTGEVRFNNNSDICWEASPAGTDICMQVDDTETLVTNIVAITGHYQGYPAVPLPDLKSVTVSDLDHDGDYDNDDFTSALTLCSPGCNLVLLPVTYINVQMVIDASPDLTSGLAIVGRGIDQTILQSHIRTGDSDDHVPIIHFAEGSPVIAYVQDLTMDGMSHVESPGTECHGGDTSITQATGIRWFTTDSSLPTVSHVVRRLRFHRFVASATYAYDFSGITLEDSIIEDIGCGTAGTGPECSAAWSACGDDANAIAGLKAGSLAVWIGNDADNFTVRRNVVRRFTKMGIQTLQSPSQDPNSCGVAAAPTGAIIEDNEIGPSSGNGIGLNGTCGVIIRRNYIHDIFTPGAEGVSWAQGIDAPTADRALIEGNYFENIQSYAINAHPHQTTPDANSYFKIIGNTMIDSCQTATTTCACMGLTQGLTDKTYPFRTIARNTCAYRDIAAAAERGNALYGILASQVSDTDFYENQFESEDRGILFEDPQNVRVFGNSFTKIGTSTPNRCIAAQNDAGDTTVAVNTYIHTTNTCNGYFNPNQLDDCVASVCSLSLGACTTNADCTVVDCGISPSSPGCATPVTTTTTTTLPASTFVAPSMTFPLGDASIKLDTGRLHYGTKTECIFLEARDGLCDTASGCLNPSPSIAGTNHDYMTMDFETAADTTGSWTFQLPKNLVGQQAEVQFIWTSNNAACNAGSDDDVCWNIDAGSVNDDEAFNVTVLDGVATAVSDKCLANGDLMRSPPLTFTHGLIAGETAVVSVTRDIDGGTCTAAGDDDYAQDARLVAVRFCHESNNLFNGE